MAKGKHSTALFEVINASKKPPAGLRPGIGRTVEAKTAASLLRTPKWWFKGRLKQETRPPAAPAPAADSNDPTANVTAATLTGPRARNAPSAVSSSGTVAAAKGEAASSAPAEPSVVARDFSEPASRPARQLPQPEPEPAAAEPAIVPSPAVKPTPATRKAPAIKKSPTAGRQNATATRSAIHFDVDHDLQEVTVRMRYTAAIIGTFAVLVVIASAYVVGRHMGESASAGGLGSIAKIPVSSTKQIKGGPPQPGVLDVGRDHAHLAAARIEGGASPHAVVPPVDPDAYEDAQVDPSGIAYRSVNRNYVVITAYPPELSDNAIKARDFLCEHAIRCTLERGLHRANPSWLYVVGTRGFPRRISDNNEYLAYCKSVVALNDKYPFKTNFNRFEPTPYKWDGN